jgi:hypothetical protein
LVGAGSAAALGEAGSAAALGAAGSAVALAADAVEEAHGFPEVPRRIDISATEIRARVARGASIRYLLPEPVRTIITEHHLSQEPSH